MHDGMIRRYCEQRMLLRNPCVTFEGERVHARTKRMCIDLEKQWTDKFYTVCSRVIQMLFVSLLYAHPPTRTQTKSQARSPTCGGRRLSPPTVQLYELCPQLYNKAPELASQRSTSDAISARARFLSCTAQSACSGSSASSRPSSVKAICSSMSLIFERAACIPCQIEHRKTSHESKR